MDFAYVKANTDKIIMKLEKIEKLLIKASIIILCALMYITFLIETAFIDYKRSNAYLTAKEFDSMNPMACGTVIAGAVRNDTGKPEKACTRRTDLFYLIMNDEAYTGIMDEAYESKTDSISTIIPDDSHTGTSYKTYARKLRMFDTTRADEVDKERKDAFVLQWFIVSLDFACWLVPAAVITVYTVAKISRMLQWKTRKDDKIPKNRMEYSSQTRSETIARDIYASTLAKLTNFRKLRVIFVSLYILCILFYAFHFALNLLNKQYEWFCLTVLVILCILWTLVSVNCVILVDTILPFMYKWLVKKEWFQRKFSNTSNNGGLKTTTENFKFLTNELFGHNSGELSHPANVTVHDPSFSENHSKFVCKSFPAVGFPLLFSDDLDEQANAELTDSFLPTHSDCSSSSTESSTESEKEQDQVEQAYPFPVFSDTWQHSATFNSNGGYMHKHRSESNLHVQKGAISSSEEVNISTAVCADFDKMLKLLEIRDDVHLASPLVEYWAGRDFSFVKDVTISLPHFLPPGIDAADVHVFCITSSTDGLKHDSADAEDGDKTKPLVASKQSYLHVQEIHHFSVFYDTLNIFTKHFCGFLCVYCDKETDKKPPRPKLYAMGGGQISTVNGQQHVDLSLHIWDERIKSTDFRRNNCMDTPHNFSMKKVELLQDFQDSQIHVSLQLNDEQQTNLAHRMVQRGQALLPCEKVFDFPRFLACKKCIKKGKMEPMEVNWAFKPKPGAPILQHLETVVQVVHSSRSQEGKKVMTTLVLRVQCQEQVVRDKRPSFLTRLLHSKSRNTPEIGASHSIPATPFQPGNQTISQADHALTLPPPLQSLQRRGALAARLALGIPATQARETSVATKRRSPRPRSLELPQDASSSSSSLEGAVGGCDCVNREMTESMEQVTLSTAELQQIVDQHVTQKLEYQTRNFQRVQKEKQALENKTKVLENETKVLEWQLRSLSSPAETSPPSANTLQLHRPAGPPENASQQGDVLVCNPSVTTSSDADVSESDSFHSCDDEQLVPPECMLDNFFLNLFLFIFLLSIFGIFLF